MAEKQRSTLSPAGTGHLGGIELAPEGPTELPLSTLDTWVVWQFPRSRQGWLCGAVHPPVEAYGWLPASIHPDTGTVRLYGHAPAPFTDPESAADWISTEVHASR